MKAWKLGLGFLLVAMPLCSATLPQNSYMRAMQDEIKRSMAKLRRPGVEKPYFIAYKLEQITQEEVAASFGALYPTQARDSQLNAYVWVDIGSAQKDSMGFAHAAYYPPYAYRPQGAKICPKATAVCARRCGNLQTRPTRLPRKRISKNKPTNAPSKPRKKINCPTC